MAELRRTAVVDVETRVTIREPAINNSATLVVGDTGTGKTSLLATLAEWVYMKYRKVTRLVAADPGGWGDMMSALIEAGVVEVWRVCSRDPDGRNGLPVGTVALASQGYWPTVINQATGDSPVAVDLKAPAAVWWEMICPKCEQAAKRVQTKGQLTAGPCKHCKTMVTPVNCKRVDQIIVRDPSFGKVGAVMFDGLTSLAEWCMTDINARAATGNLGGEKGNMNTVHSSGLSFGTSGRGGVGFVQNRGMDWINNSLNIQGLVVPPYFTARELRATDDDAMPIYGPKLIGKAKTSDIPSWVGNCLGTTIAIGAEGRREFRLYLQEYREPGSTIPHLCKVRSIPGVCPEYLADDEGEEAFTKFNLGHFQELVLAGRAKATARTNSRLELKDGKADPVASEDVPLAVKSQKPPSEPVKPATTPAAVRPATRPVGPPAAQPATAPAVAGRPAPRPPAAAPPAARPRPPAGRPAVPPPAKK